MMAGSGDDDGLAALHEQVALASSAAISASDLDYAFQLQLFEAIQASLRGQSSPNAAAASSSASPLPFRSRSLPLMRPAPSRSRPPTSRWRSRTTATPRPATPRSPSPPSRRTGGPLRATSSSARFWTRPPPRARTSASFPRAWRAHGHGEHRDTGPIGEVVLRMQKPVEGSVGGRMTLEVMALMEGLDAALGLGIRSVTIVTDYGPLHNHIHTKKRNRLEHQRLNKLVYVSYNRKMENRFANIRELGCKGKKSNPLVLEEFLWQNEWVEDCHEGDGDGANIWTAVDDAIGATQGLQGRNLPRIAAATSSQPQHTYVRTRKRPRNAATIDICDCEEDENGIDQPVQAESPRANEEGSESGGEEAAGDADQFCLDEDLLL